MYNNEVTYSKEWDTPENRAALKTLEKKFFDRSICYPDCPVAWAPEVLNLLNTIDEEFGIALNTSTMRSYYIQGDPIKWFITGPVKNTISTFYEKFIKRPDPQYEWEIKDRNQPISTRLIKVVNSGLHPIKYGLKALKITKINPIINHIRKPKVTLNQVKEKYGELRIYFTSPDYLEKHIEHLIAKTEIKLAIKGCYYPIENFWNAGTSYTIGTDTRPDIARVEEKSYRDGEKYLEFFQTTHRTAMKELGLDLQNIEVKYMLQQQKRSEEP